MNPVSVDGILNINKPRDWTSFDVVAFVRRRSGIRRVGHAGTLDPAATGVLPVCLGKATRVIEYLTDTRKVYRATLLLGQATDTFDTTGQVTSIGNARSVTAAGVEAAIESFRGEIDQVAPAFSAIKQDGVPLYRLARAGKAVAPPSRRVTIFRLDLLSFENPRVEIEVECSKGTYIRSLANDIGAHLGVGGCLEALVRTRVGTFALDSALEIESLGEEFDNGSWRDRLQAADEVILSWPAAIVSSSNLALITSGRPPELPDKPSPSLKPGTLCRAYSTGGDFIAILRRTPAHEWHPEKVFSDQAPGS